MRLYPEHMLLYFSLKVQATHMLSRTILIFPADLAVQ